MIKDMLLAAGIVRAPLKGFFDTPTQTLSDHLGFIISILDKGSSRVPERRYFALCRQPRALIFEAVKNRRLVDSDLLRRFGGAVISCLSAFPLAHFHLREVFNTQEQYKPRSFLSQAVVDNLLFHDLLQNVESLRGHTVKLYQDNQTDCLWSAPQNVIQVTKLGGCVIATTGPRHVVLATAHTTRALTPGRIDIGLSGLQITVCIQRF